MSPMNDVYSVILILNVVCAFVYLVKDFRFSTLKREGMNFPK